MFHTDAELKQTALALTTAAIQKSRLTAEVNDCERMVCMYFRMLETVIAHKDKEFEPYISD